MKFDVGIESIQAEVKGNILVICSSEPLRVLSSAVLNGGLKEANGIVNVQVPEKSGEDKNDVHWNAEGFLKAQVQILGLSNNTVGLMTAAKMKNVATATRKCSKTTVTLFVTAGKTVAVTAGEPAASKNTEKHGTINIILLVDGNMTDGCMVEAVKTITEAKTVALRELDLRSQFSGDLATGTLTDTLAVACTKKGERINFAGTFTLIGELIAQCVRDCVKEAIYKQENFAADRPLSERLSERGIQTERILSLLADVGIPVGSSKYLQIKKELEQSFTDKKIASLVLASLRFDDDLNKGLIPELGESAIDRVSFERIVLAAIRDYLSNEEGASESEGLKLNLRNETELGPFTTCVLEAILKDAYSKVTS
jgi:iron complex transport system ATP-binding protein